MMRKIEIKYTSFLGILLLILFVSGCGEDKAIVFRDFSTEIEKPINNETIGKEELSEEVEQKTIFVHVCGAVCSPGVYELPETCRAIDAVMAAGGLTKEANENSVNLALKLKDGEKLYIPNVTDEEEENTLININSANAEELCALPGVGKARAMDIVADRNKNGPFLEKEDIMRVSGIKESVYQKICDQITVN